MNRAWQQVFEGQVGLDQWGPRCSGDERSKPRVDWSGHVIVRAGTQRFLCAGVDLSEGGLRVNAERDTFAGQKVSVTFELFGQVVHAIGVVSWAAVGAVGRVWGIRFTALRQRALRRITDYIMTRMSPPKDSEDSPLAGRFEPWVADRTVPVALGLSAASLPGVPEYVPVRTGHTQTVTLPGHLDPLVASGLIRVSAL